MQLNHIIHGDAKTEMARMPKESMAGIVTSPPYNLKNSTGNGMKGSHSSGKWANAALVHGYDEHDDCMPRDEYVAWQRDVLSECMRVVRPDGAVFYNHKRRVQKGLMQDPMDILHGFPVRQIIVWERSGGMNFNPGYFLPTYELIYLIAKPAFRLAPKMNRYGDVWRIPQVSNTKHPAPFPLELASRCVRAIGRGPILDPFMGSGTTALAAAQAGLPWVGIEKAKRYVDEAMSHLKEIAE